MKKRITQINITDYSDALSVVANILIIQKLKLF